ncbi:MAG: hypothetical protein E7656_03305 [Ruminococcaceae bacterium]|nr:hypothetical protein [Oscillospiraceae bacterium]
MKKICLFLAIIMLALPFAGCSAKNVDLYKEGLSVASIMHEMVNSEEYADMMGVPNLLEDVTERVKELDFSKPESVYKLSLPTSEELVKNMGIADTYGWDNIPDTLKTQIENRVGFSTVANMINSTMGQEYIAFCSLYSAVVKNEAISAKEPVTYLYVFNAGIGVAVTFTDGLAQGTFLFEKDLFATDELEQTFAPFGIGFAEIKA